MNSNTIYDFSSDSKLKGWRIVDDVVMGGRSNGSFKLNKEGHAVFSGAVSLENNGGFSSVRYNFDKKDISKYSKIKLTVKGDGKKYKFRIKDKSRRYYSYSKEFSTTKEWQEIEISLSDMVPTFRGRTLNQPNFNHDFMEELAILIANYKNEEFELLIDKIELE